MLMLLSSTLSVTAGNKKRQLRAAFQQAVELMNTPTAQIPDFIANDQAVSKYCGNILNITDEQYSQDTAQVNALFQKAALLQSAYPDEELTQLLIKKKYDVSRLYDLSAWGSMILSSLPKRYSMLTNYCELQLKRRREAAQRTMPTGQLLRLDYEETGSSRPTPVGYWLYRNETTGQWVLSGMSFSFNRHEKVSATLTNEDVTQVCDMLKAYKVYKCLSYYEDESPFLNNPIQLGGPPSWNFSCQLEGGEICSSSECLPVPDNIARIVNHLHGLLTKSMQTSP